MILCVASIIHGVLILSQLRPKFVQIAAESLFCRCCLALVGQPLVAGASIAQSLLNSPYPNGVLGVLKHHVSAVPGRFTLPFHPAGLRQTAVPYRATGDSALFSDFFRFVWHCKKPLKKTSLQKLLFCDFGSPRRRFLAIFGPKTGPRMLLFRCFFENGDFVKIALPPRK